MESAIGMLCLVLLPVTGGGFGFWLMYRRINRLQHQLSQLEYRLGQIEITPTVGMAQPAVTPASSASLAPDATPDELDASETEIPSSFSAARSPLDARTPAMAETSAPESAPPAGPQARPLTLPPAGAAAEFLQPAGSSLPVAGRATPRRGAPRLVNWFLHMHVLVQIGLVVLLIGVALLLRYAVDQGWLSLEIRHLGAAAGGAALGVTGWFAYKKQRGYGLALQGGGLAILYLTVFSAYRVYTLLPAPVAFAFFVGISVFGILLALLQDARILAYVAMVGAFAAPILAAEGGGNYVALLGYYAVIAVTALVMALRKGWQGLALLSLLATYVVGIANSAENFAPADYVGMLGFIAFFFGIFLAASLLLARQAGQGRRVLDLVVAVLNPLLALLWLVIITDHIDKGLGYGLIAGGAIYLGVFGGLAWKRPAQLAVQRELSLFWGLFLLSMAAPIFVDVRITASIWAVAGALWVWLGWRRSMLWMALWGAITQLAAGVGFTATSLDALDRALQPATGYLPFANEFTMGWVIVALAGMISAWLLWRMAQQEQWLAHNGLLRAASFLIFLWGATWWFGGGLVEATTAPTLYVASTMVVFLTLSTVLMDWIGRRLTFAPLRAPLWGLLPALAALALLQTWEVDSPWQGGAWLAWPLALAAHGWMLHRNGGARFVAIYHAGGVWLATYLAVAAVNGALLQASAGATLMASAILALLALIIWFVTAFAGRLPAPVGPYAHTYRLWGAGPVVGVGVLALLRANLAVDGANGWLPFAPLLNPLAWASASLLAASLYWLVVARTEAAENVRPALWSLRWGWWALLIFSMSAELARSVHHLLGMPLTWDGLYASSIFQTLLAVLWGIVALGLMGWGSRRRTRSAWFAGVSVLGLTLVKLFLVDLAGAGTVARIVSFIGVGLLILVIAFVAPAPPRREVEAPGD